MSDPHAAVPFIPAAEVIAELAKSPLPREARAAMAALSTETLKGNPPSWTYSWSPFRCEFGFNEWRGSLATFPDWGGNADHNTHAIGVWQDEPKTYAAIAKFTRDASFEPQSQITNNWALAVQDYGHHFSGGDLLAALKAGQLDTVSPALIHTWPGGADAGFAARYRYALSLFPVDTPAPAPTPPPTQPPDLSIPLGLQFTCPIAGTLMDHSVPVPFDALASSDPSVCTVTISDPNVTFAGRALGTVHVTGPGQDRIIAVVPAEPDHLYIDLAHGTFSKISAVTNAMVARLPMLAMAAALMLPALPAGSPGSEKSLIAEAGFFLEKTVSKSEFYFPELRVSSLPSTPCPPKDLRWLLSPSPCVQAVL